MAADILRFNFVFAEKSHNLQIAAEKNSGKLIVRCYGFFGMEDKIPDYRWDYIMEEGDWDKLMMIIEDANATKWDAAYINESEENAAEWSLEIHVLGKHTISEGYNKFPKEFETFKQDLIRFATMKRRQLEPGDFDFRYFAVAEQIGLTSPIVMIDNMEKTFTAYNLLDSYENDGSYFMKDGDWESIVEIVHKYDIFSKFKGMPAECHPEKQTQCSVSVGYQPGQITQRYNGYIPEWWNDFSKEIFSKIKAMYLEGRKSADQNFGAI